ncbi:MAG: hypothetical protein JXA96_02920 [Sedimentisphaerales bacterium]|nr:hypothetical protein [Sedimentisphaerales bacterium]
MKYMQDSFLKGNRMMVKNILFLLLCLSSIQLFANEYLKYDNDVQNTENIKRDNLVLEYEDLIDTCLEKTDKGGQDSQIDVNAICMRLRNDSNSVRTFYVLTYALYSGLYQIPVKALDIVDIESFNDNKLDIYLLVARSLACKYNKYIYYHDIGKDWPTKDEWGNLKAIAKDCTSAYEKALSEAKDAYTMAQISTEWWPLNNSPYYIADSIMLRNTYPFNMPQYNEKKLKEQVEYLRKEIQKCFSSKNRKVEYPIEIQEKILNTITNQYAEFGKLGIPDDVFKDFIEGLPLFLDEGHPFHLHNEYMNFFDDTMAFYIWHALTIPKPNYAERLVIDKNINRIYKMIQVEVDKQYYDKYYVPIGDAVSEQTMNFYNLTSGNRLYPYFKNIPLNPAHNQYNYVLNSINKSSEIFKKKVKGFPEDSSLAENKLLERYKEEEFRTVRTLAGSIIRDLCNYTPMYSYGLPDEFVLNSTGLYNEFGYYHFVIKEKRKYGNYPLTKQVIYRTPKKADGD